MPSFAEIALAWHGCLRLMRLDPNSLAYFDRSPQGALRSFTLAIPLYPYYLLQVWSSDVWPNVPDPARYIASMSIAYAFLWIVFPLVLLGLTRVFDAPERAAGCIAMYNWASLLVLAINLPILGLDLAGVETGPSWIAPVIVSLFLNTYIFRLNLGITILPAILLVVFDFFLGQIVILPTFAHLGGFTPI